MIERRDILTSLLLGGLAWAGHGRAVAQPGGRPMSGEASHRIQIDLPIIADDPVAVPLTVSVDHPMDAEHYVRSLEIVLGSDPVPRKGQFLFTPWSGRASVAYQVRSGQGGELTVVGECTQHGRFEAKERLRVAPGGCAVPPGATTRERGSSPSVRTEARIMPGQVVPVWASLKHTSHTGLVEQQGKVVQARPPYYVERMSVFVGDRLASEFRLTPALSPDPKLRFFVKGDPGRALRVVFVDNRGERWEATQRMT